MEKYSKKMINDYILGNDIKEYSIERLENDKEFMMLVIGATNDEKFYNSCSEKLKKDYSFVRYLIEKFKSHNKLYVAIKISENFFGFNEENKILTIPFYYVSFFINALKDASLDKLIK